MLSQGTTSDAEAGPIPPPTAAWTDEELVAACLTGNERAWHALITKYRVLVLWVLRRYGAPSEDAADAFQLVCVELFRTLPRIRNSKNVRPWLVTVASHEALRCKRRRQKLLTEVSEGIDVLHAGPAAAPSQSLERAQTADIMRRAIAQLPPRQRELVRLLFFEDPPPPYEVVAAKLGLTPSSVACIRARSLKKLRRLLMAGQPYLERRPTPPPVGEGPKRARRRIDGEVVRAGTLTHVGGSRGTATNREGAGSPSASTA
jgi:RNA polymerase sigma factor (sigma-70 family)